MEIALDFTPDAGEINLSAQLQHRQLTISVINQGQPIPSYALDRLCERFYSLPRPNNGRKSTGLGLNFVSEVAQLHGARLTITNIEIGVEAKLVFKHT